MEGAKRVTRWAVYRWIRWRNRGRKLRCYVLGHTPVIVGHCTQTKPHFCPKGRLVCRRCKQTHTDQGWRDSI